MNTKPDLELFSRVKADDQKAFGELFFRYYPLLCAFVSRYLPDDAKTEELVQEVFVRIWEKRREISITASVKSYLFRAVKNEVINRLEHEKTEQKFLEKSRRAALVAPDEQQLPEVDLLQKIEKAIEALPPKRQEIFRLSREAGLSYREIAAQLNLSVKTVEAQMGLALKQLRDSLKDYRHLLIGWHIARKIF